MPSPAPLSSPVRPTLLNDAGRETLYSAVDITDFGSSAYGEFAAAAALLFQNPASYGEGIRVGYSLLTGGASPDFGIGCFAVRCDTARKTAGQTPDAGHGAMDVWRLLMENNYDVAAVVARVSN